MTVPGLQGGGDKQNQPQDSLRTPPHVGYTSNPKGGEQSPPPTGGRSEIQDTERVGGKGGDRHGHLRHMSGPCKRCLPYVKWVEK